MPKKKRPLVEVSENKVYFGRWYMEVKVDRQYDHRAGKELGIMVLVSGGMSHRTGTEPYTFTAPLLPPDSTLQDAEEIEDRLAQALAPLAEEFLRRMEEEVKHLTAIEAQRLVKEEEDE
jgi:hypothetical protein